MILKRSFGLRSPFDSNTRAVMALAISQVKVALVRLVVASARYDAALSEFIFLSARNDDHKLPVHQRHLRKAECPSSCLPALSASRAGARLLAKLFQYLCAIRRSDQRSGCRCFVKREATISSVCKAAKKSAACAPDECATIRTFALLRPWCDGR